MKVNPGNDYVFEMRSHKLVVRFFWLQEDGIDDEQFTLTIIQDAVRHGADIAMDAFKKGLPLQGPIDELEAYLQRGITSTKQKGWSVRERSFDTGFN